MFERFTEQARAAVVQAQAEARSLGHGWIGTEHLLLAVLADEGSGVTTALRELGLDAGRVRQQVLAEAGVGVDDDTALSDLGIDLDAVRHRVEERFGPGAMDAPPPRPRSRRGRWRGRRRAGGHIPFTSEARKVLEQALREAVHLRSGEIAAPHLVLGMLHDEGTGTRLASGLGVQPDDVRRAVRALLDRAA